MANINLTTSSESSESKGAALADKSVLGLFAVLVVVLIIYGGILFGKSYFSGKITALQVEYKNENDKFSLEKAKNVSDFQKRMDLSKELINKGFNAPDFLSKIEKSMVPNVYLDNYKYEEKTNILTLTYVGDNYNVVARQILSLKAAKDSSGAAFFPEVVAGKSSLDKELNKIIFLVDLKIK